MFPGRKICAQTTSAFTFCSCTATRSDGRKRVSAGALRTLTAAGSKATVSLADKNGLMASALTIPFGYFSGF